MSANHAAGVKRLTINEDPRQMIERAQQEQIETVWDRLPAQEPRCEYCSLGLSVATARWDRAVSILLGRVPPKAFAELMPT